MPYRQGARDIKAIEGQAISLGIDLNTYFNKRIKKKNLKTKNPMIITKAITQNYSQQNFFISCKKLRIETNTCFYGCFYLGPFDPGQSLTIANALRRTLLSELKGLKITSVEIEGAFHEYSILHGIQDSVLDILLNLKEVVLMSRTYNPTNIIKTQIGYLRAQGPGIIRAADLKLPPYIQCINPEQYIATLSEDGFLNMKIFMNEGKNYHIQKPSKTLAQQSWFKTRSNIKTNRLLIDAVFMPVLKVNYIIESNEQANDFFVTYETKNPLFFTNNLQSDILILKKKFETTKKVKWVLPGVLTSAKQKKNFKIVLKSKSIMCVSTYPSKGTYRLTKIQSKKLVKLLCLALPVSTTGKARHKSLTNLKAKLIQKIFYSHNSLKKKILSPAGSFIFDSSSANAYGRAAPLPLQRPSADASLKSKKSESIVITPLDKVVSQQFSSKIKPFLKQGKTLLSHGIHNRSREGLEEFVKTGFRFSNPHRISINHEAKFGKENNFKIKNLKTIQSKIDKKHNLVLEIWTNGSVHPRDALYQAIKNILIIFSKLKQVRFLGAVYKSEKNYKKFLKIFVQKWKNHSK